VRGKLGDDSIAGLPEGALDLDTLRDYLGPTAARAASELAVGEVSAPVRGSAGYFVLVLRERLAEEPAPFETLREQVRAEYLRSRGETALTDYLSELREAAEIRVLDPELAAP
jgi:parvulin-like peptidyl-prolyl isomerase